MSQSPLAGRRVLITRPADRGAALANLLEEKGATVVSVPLIAIQFIATHAAVRTSRDALARHEGARWLAVTSAAAVQAIAGPLHELGGLPAGARVLAVGPATAKALGAAGLQVDLMPAHADAASAAELLIREGVAGARVWFPGAARGRGTLPALLRRAGAAVDVQVAYQTVVPADAGSSLDAVLADGRVDAILFASGSAVNHLFRLLGDRPYPAGALPVCIGPVTAAAARAAGLPTPTVARAPSPRAVLDAIITGLARQSVP